MTVHPAAVRTTVTEAQDAPQRVRNVLVLALPNARCDELLRRLRARTLAGDTRFTLVVPAVPAGLDWLADMSAGRGTAEERLANLVWRCARHALPVADAHVGAPDAVAAAMDAVNFGDFDEVVLASMRPRRTATRLGVALAHRLQRATGLPVEHVVCAPVRHPAGALRRAPARVELDAPARPLAAA
jgi:hypothetical protein